MRRATAYRALHVDRAQRRRMGLAVGFGHVPTGQQVGDEPVVPRGAIIGRDLDADPRVAEVVDAGQVAEMGTHDELIAAKGLYYRLHELQHTDSNVLIG